MMCPQNIGLDMSSNSDLMRSGHLSFEFRHSSRNRSSGNMRYCAIIGVFIIARVAEVVECREVLEGGTIAELRVKTDIAWGD